MTRRRKSWWWAAVAVTTLWITVGLLVRLTHRLAPTAEKTLAFVAARPLGQLPAEEERQALIDQVTDQVNRLPFVERHRLRQEPRMQEFYESLTETEKMRYLDRTLSSGVRQLMEAFNQMSPERRRELVEQSLRDIEHARMGGREYVQRVLSPAATQRIIQEGLTGYFRDANADTKLDLQPLIEQMHHLVQSAH